MPLCQLSEHPTDVKQQDDRDEADAEGDEECDRSSPAGNYHTSQLMHFGSRRFARRCVTRTGEFRAKGVYPLYAASPFSASALVIFATRMDFAMPRNFRILI